MRLLGWTAAVSLLILFNSAITYAGCASCGGNDTGGYRSYRGPAGFSPPGYCLAPGCCECPPSACDNAWDGYCEEKAKWRAYFAQVGTPRVHHHGCPTMVPAEACDNSPTAQPIQEPQPATAAKANVLSSPYTPTMSPGKAASKSDAQWFRY
jgi:hypothetical protein